MPKQLHKTDALSRARRRQRTTANDLQNILYSTDVATLFLDKSLNIRFFTPATKALFAIIPERYRAPAVGSELAGYGRRSGDRCRDGFTDPGADGAGD
jgi:PAS domain-containing protein